MTTSTYLIRITRLLVLCAVVAGAAASVAGAYDGRPLSYGERWQGVDQAYGLTEADGLKADGLRWQGIAKVYRDLGRSGNGPSAEGLKADGLRWQGIAKVYRDLGRSGNGPSAEGLKADGLRWQGIAKVYRDLGEPAVVPVSSGGAFDWGDWAIGLGAGFGLALGVAGGVLLATHRIPQISRTGATAAG